MNDLYRQIRQEPLPSIADVQAAMAWYNAMPLHNQEVLSQELRNMPINQNSALGIARYWKIKVQPKENQQ